MRRKAVARLVQRTFDDLLRKRRKGGGRKKSPDSGVSHRKRPRVAEATSWLLREGWKIYGLFELRPAWDKTIID